MGGQKVIMSKEGVRGVHKGRILCIHQGALGDCILALPAIKALRDMLQPARLEIMGHPWILPLIQGHPYADAIADVNRAEMALLFQEGVVLPATVQAYLSGFDAAFCFGLSATLGDNLQRAGIKKTFLLPPLPGGRQHVTLHHLQSLARLGIDVLPSSPRIYLKEEERNEASGFFRERGWEPDGIIALHPGAGSRKKAWSSLRFAALGRALASESKRLLIVEGPADAECVDQVLKGLDGVPHLVASDLPVRQVAALLSCASLFIGNDSGCSHLAAALGVHTVALFGPTDPQIWAPQGERAFWLQGTVACAPCARETQRRCEQQRCLDAITIDAVLTCIAEGMKTLHEAPCDPRSPMHQQRVGHEVLASVQQ
jgi:ADP-heptose:LPS heptosyltransferase